MHDDTLNRVSYEYRRGYRDGESGYPCKYPPPALDILNRPFGKYDYIEGYKAGSNDQYWRTVYAGLCTDIRTKICGLFNY